MVRRLELLWDDWNEEHVARHGVDPEEHDEVARNSPYMTRGRGRTYRVIGVTDRGRLLTLVVVREVGSTYDVVTARDADDHERRAYRRR